MQLAMSNIALPAYEHSSYLPLCAELGFSLLEVAPSRVWLGAGHGVRAAEVDAYRRTVEAAGLGVCGLHSLFFDRPDLSIFGDSDSVSEAVALLGRLSALCRDLGGRTLVFGSPGARRRGSLSKQEADRKALLFLERTCEAIDGHGTVLSFEALGPTESDYVNSLAEASLLVDAIGHRAFGLHIDAKAASESGELDGSALPKFAERATHVHVNEAGLGPLHEVAQAGSVAHDRLGSALRQANYRNAVSLEMRMISKDHDTILSNIAQSRAVMKERYGA